MINFFPLTDSSDVVNNSPSVNSQTQSNISPPLQPANFTSMHPLPQSIFIIPLFIFVCLRYLCGTSNCDPPSYTTFQYTKSTTTTILFPSMLKACIGMESRIKHVEKGGRLSLLSKINIGSSQLFRAFRTIS